MRMGSQFANVGNTLSIPEWTRVDLGARYVIDRPGQKPILLRAYVENIADKGYCQTALNNTLYYGRPRTFNLSAQFSF